MSKALIVSPKFDNKNYCSEFNNEWIMVMLNWILVMLNGKLVLGKCCIIRVDGSMYVQIIILLILKSVIILILLYYNTKYNSHHGNLQIIELYSMYIN